MERVSEKFKRGSRGGPALKLWQETLLVMTALYLLGLVVLLFTSNPNLFPTVVILGSLVVPVTFVIFFYNNRLSNLEVSEIALCFIYGGVLSIYIAAILEHLIFKGINLRTLFAAGFLEELVKVATLVFLVRWGTHVSEMNGIILGAAVGMGFAALESSGYSFSAFLASGGDLSLTTLVTLIRGLLSPIGHGAWTAILGGVLFRESAPFRFRLDYILILTYIGVSTLHGLWNSLSFMISNFLISFLGSLLVGVVSLFFLYLVWEESKKRQSDQNIF